MIKAGQMAHGVNHDQSKRKNREARLHEKFVKKQADKKKVKKK